MRRRRSRQSSMHKQQFMLLIAVHEPLTLFSAFSVFLTAFLVRLISPSSKRMSRAAFATCSRWLDIASVKDCCAERNSRGTRMPNQCSGSRGPGAAAAAADSLSSSLVSSDGVTGGLRSCGAGVLGGEGCCLGSRSSCCTGSGGAVVASPCCGGEI